MIVRTGHATTAVPACRGLVNWAFLGVSNYYVFGLYAGYNHFALFHHWVHYHRSDDGSGSYWRRLDRLHNVHHQRQGSNFGVSTTIWDGIFGTFRPARDQRKSSCSNGTAEVSAPSPRSPAVQ